jgi:creatinine amidohydrolase
VNGHDGNEYFLPHFIRLQLARPKDYVVYLSNPGRFTLDKKLGDKWAEVSENPLGDELAGESETSAILAICPEFSDMSTVPSDEGPPLGRLSHLEKADIYTAIGWYANFPHHHAGRGSLERQPR